jgi:hypothetical protein
MDFRGAEMQAAEAKDRLAAKDAEIGRLRQVIDQQRAALREIDSWRHDTLGSRRCSDRARKALAILI